MSARRATFLDQIEAGVRAAGRTVLLDGGLETDRGWRQRAVATAAR